ncbi:unnamed protein product, partial [Sphacelaria rigidula]
QEGTPETEKIFGAVLLEDDSIVLAGFTRGNWTETSAGGSDFCAARLDSDGTVLWRWQGGTDEDEWVTGAVAATRTTVLLAGTTEGDWFDKSTSTSTLTPEDLAIIALDVGTVIPVVVPTLPPTPFPTAPPSAMNASVTPDVPTPSPIDTTSTPRNIWTP